MCWRQVWERTFLIFCTRTFLKNIYKAGLVKVFKPDQYFSVFSKVDVVYVDIAQPDQTKIAIANCKMYLKKRGILFLVIKSRSIDVTKEPNQIINEEIKKLQSDFEILQRIDLKPFDKDHAMIIARSLD